jgi:hypothetical protein
MAAVSASGPTGVAGSTSPTVVGGGSVVGTVGAGVSVVAVVAADVVAVGVVGAVCPAVGTVGPAVGTVDVVVAGSTPTERGAQAADTRSPRRSVRHRPRMVAG